jgi:hypothetical protein
MSNISAYRGYRASIMEYLELQINLLDKNHIYLSISCTYESEYVIYNHIYSIIKIKLHNNFDLYDTIMIVFDNIIQYFAHLIRNEILADCIIGNVEGLGIPTDNINENTAIPLTRKNTKHISHIYFDYDSFPDDILYEGEIFEDGTFLHNYVV